MKNIEDKISEFVKTNREKIEKGVKLFFIFVLGFYTLITFGFTMWTILNPINRFGFYLIPISSGALSLTLSLVTYHIATNEWEWD